MPKGGKKNKGGNTAVAEPETATAVEEAPKAKKAKKEQPERVGMSTKEAAALLGVTPVKLRRILRTTDFADDKEYTRYDLDDATIERLRAAIAAGADGTRKPRKGKKNAEVQEDAEDVESAVAELEDSSDEEDLEDLDLEDDEDEEDDE